MYFKTYMFWPFNLVKIKDKKIPLNNDIIIVKDNDSTTK